MAFLGFHSMLLGKKAPIAPGIPTMMKYFEAWYLYTIGLLLFVPAISIHVPLGSSLSDFARMLEGPAVHLAIFALLLSLTILIFGKISYGAFGMLLSLAALIHIYLIIPQIQSEEVERGQEVSLLVANIEGALGGNHEEIFRNIVKIDPDIVFIMESNPKLEDLFIQSGRYEHELPCSWPRCDNHVFSKYSMISAARVQLIHIWPSPRLAVLKLALANDAELSLFLTHLTKAWIPDSEIERALLLDRLSNQHGPLVVAGDFNAAPWSAQMRQFKTLSSIHFKTVSPATWPSEFGAFGIPIDHVGVKGGVELISLEPWLGASGSNHRGLLAKLRVKSLVGEK